MKKTKEECSLRKLVDVISKEFFCDKFKCKLPKLKSDYIEKIDVVFEEMEGVYNNRNKYNLHWAFENAQTKSNDFIEDILERKLKPQLEYYKIENRIPEDVSKLYKIKEKLESSTKRRFQLFSFLSSMVTFVEIIISLIIVIVISRLSHTGETFISSAYLSLLFIGIVALFKVTLENYVIRPKIEKWGWSLYNKAINRFKSNIALLLSMTNVLQESTNEESDLPSVVSMVKVGIENAAEYK